MTNEMIFLRLQSVPSKNNDCSKIVVLNTFVNELFGKTLRVLPIQNSFNHSEGNGKAGFFIESEMMNKKIKYFGDFGRFIELQGLALSHISY